MRQAAIVVAMVVMGCSDRAAVPPDAEVDLFGGPCTNHGWSPLETCVAGDQIGWCIAPEGGSGTCRRGCNGGHACHDGETMTAIYDDCYCAP